MTFAAPPPMLKIELDRVRAREVSLDLYRTDRARAGQPVLPSPAVPDVPFAEWVAGPDYVAGKASSESRRRGSIAGRRRPNRR